MSSHSHTPMSDPPDSLLIGTTANSYFDHHDDDSSEGTVSPLPTSCLDREDNDDVEYFSLNNDQTATEITSSTQSPSHDRLLPRYDITSSTRSSAHSSTHLRSGRRYTATLSADIKKNLSWDAQRWRVDQGGRIVEPAKSMERMTLNPTQSTENHAQNHRLGSSIDVAQPSLVMHASHSTTSSAEILGEAASYHLTESSRKRVKPEPALEPTPEPAAEHLNSHKRHLSLSPSPPSTNNKRSRGPEDLEIKVEHNGAEKNVPLNESNPPISHPQEFRQPNPDIRARRVEGNQTARNELLPAFEILNIVLPRPSMSEPDSLNCMAKVSVNNKAYSIIEKIAKGGSSFVFKVLSHRDHKNYALKAVPLEGIDQNTTRMYTNEIKLLISLRANPRIVQIFDYEISERHNALFVIMELGEIDMAHLLSRQKYEPLDLNFVRYYWRQMLKAVEAVHKEKIVHSDLKPANFVLVSGMLKIIDFGIAKRIANNTTNIHRDKQVGTINYMAPEALTDVGHGQNELMKMGRPSDVWSLGCILYQMVYGRPPFSDMKLFHKLRFIPDPTHVIPFPSQAPVYSPGDFTHDPVTLPAEIIDVMQSCLQRDPSKRKKIPQLLDHPFLKV